MKYQYCIEPDNELLPSYKSPPLVAILGPISAIHTSPYCFYRVEFDIVFPPCIVLHSGLFTSDFPTRTLYEGQLISNAHSEISRKRDHVFKQTKVGSKVKYFSYKLTYLFFDIVALSFNTFFLTQNKFTHAVNEEFRSSLFDPRRHSLLHFII